MIHNEQRKDGRGPGGGNEHWCIIWGHDGEECQKDASLLAVLLVAGTTPRPPLPHPRPPVAPAAL